MGDVLTDPLSQIYERDGVRVLPIAGDVDMSNCAIWEAAIVGAMDRDPRPLILDLASLSYCDSTFVNALIRLRRKFQGRMWLVLPKLRKMRRVFEIMKLEHVLDFKDDLRSAIAESRSTKVIRRILP